MCEDERVHATITYHSEEKLAQTSDLAHHDDDITQISQRVLDIKSLITGLTVLHNQAHVNVRSASTGRGNSHVTRKGLQATIPITSCQ